LALCDGETPLGSAHDILKWIGVDKDGQHHDWNNWLKEKLYAVAADPRKPLIIEYHRFNGILTPMVNVAACRLMIRLCVNKSKVADAIADEALKLWTERMSQDLRLPTPARDFLRGKQQSFASESSEPDLSSIRVRRQTAAASSCRVVSDDSRPPRALPEPCLSWIKDLGADRKEIPAAKATLKSLFEIEVAAGGLQKNPQPNCSAPQHRFRDLAEAALRLSRLSVQQRLSTIAAAGTPPLTTATTLTAEVVVVSAAHSSSSSSTATEIRVGEEPEEEEEDDILRVSEVMRAAEVWEPVWKTFMSDLSNRMLQIKCEDTNGNFSERRPQKVHHGISVEVHKYKKPDDWSIARRALRETKDLYEKRIREFLERAFLLGGVFDDVPLHTYAGICAATARRIADQLIVL